jgi:hypothetical protein
MKARKSNLKQRCKNCKRLIPIRNLISGLCLGCRRKEINKLTKKLSPLEAYGFPSRGVDDQKIKKEGTRTLSNPASGATKQDGKSLHIERSGSSSVDTQSSEKEKHYTERDIQKKLKMLDELIIKNVRRKVVCVYGKFDNESDFVLEPAAPSDKDWFYIYGKEEKE